MPQDSILYDLVLLLSTDADDETRAGLIADTEAAIAAGDGNIARTQAWGTRPTAYPIAHQSDADYHLLQFTGPPALLETLSHSLRIADTVLRFRIIKVVPGTPEAPESAPPVLVGAPEQTATVKSEAA